MSINLNILLVPVLATNTVRAFELLSEVLFYQHLFIRPSNMYLPSLELYEVLHAQYGRRKAGCEPELR